MSPIGRIFIVLNLVLAAAFLGWAASALSLSQEWKTKHETLSEERNTLEQEKDEEIASLRVQLHAEQNSLDQAQEAQALAEANATQLRSDLEAARRDKDRLDANLTSITATLEDFRSTIEQVSSARDRAESERREAVEERDAALEAAREAELAERDAEDALQRATTQIADLETELTATRSEASQAQTTIALIADRYGIDIREISAVPQIDATVVSARYDDAVAPGLVALNVGSADGVKRGFVFEIYRGNTYKGQVRVESVEENRCAAIIKTMTEGSQIESGDRASTRL